MRFHTCLAICLTAVVSLAPAAASASPGWYSVGFGGIRGFDGYRRPALTGSALRQGRNYTVTRRFGNRVTDQVQFSARTRVNGRRLGQERASALAWDLARSYAGRRALSPSQRKTVDAIRHQRTAGSHHQQTAGLYERQTAGSQWHAKLARSLGRIAVGL